jgi:hypothetical protein
VKPIEISRTKEEISEKISELDTNSKNKNIEDLNIGVKDFKKGYQHRTQ